MPVRASLRGALSSRWERGVAFASFPALVPKEWTIDLSDTKFAV